MRSISSIFLVPFLEQMIAGYLSPDHLGDLDGQCPRIALPSDVARSNPQVQAAYQQLLDAMVGIFEKGFEERTTKARRQVLSVAALCVGGMVLARALPDSELADEVRRAAEKTALKIAAVSY